jgi:GT2 family glycosyltransferase/glycosyltransferase involved in cell wall biosynthesis
MEIFVLGMHRSGTSVVTRLINLMGAYFGPEEISTGANPENPKGFWERRDVRDENDAVLWSAGADWWKVADFSLAKAQKRFSRNASKTIRDLNNHSPSVIKEPRFCLLFPMWRRLVKSPICVLVHRSPVQVAHSLEYRNGFPLSFGAALWERYVLDALAATADLPRILVSYERIVADPAEQVDLLLGELSSAGVEGLHRPSKGDVSSFVSPDLFHNRQTVEEQLGLLNSQQLELASALASGTVPALDEVPTISPKAERALRLFEEVSKTTQSELERPGGGRTPSADSKKARSDEMKPNSDLATVRARAMAYLGDSKDLRIDIDQLSAERDALRKRTRADRREIEKLHTRLDDTEKSLDRARSTSKSRGRSLKLLKTDVESSTEEISQLTARCHGLEESVATARAEQALLQGRLAELKTTLSDTRAEKKSLEMRSAKAERELARISNELDISKKERGQAMHRIEELEPKVAKLVEAEAARDYETKRASGLAITVETLEKGLAAWRIETAKAKSRQHDLERSTEELLVFLRRAQHQFEGIENASVRKLGPIELRSHRQSTATRTRLTRLFREIGTWVRRHHNELVAMIDSASRTDARKQPLASATPTSTTDAGDLTIDVIVCVHDSLEQVRRCLDSVIPTLGRRHSLIVVDDGSCKETADFLSRFATGHDQVKLIRRDTAGGYTKAANSGIENSSAEFVVLLNSDTQVPTTWLKKLVRAAYRSTDIGIVGPLSNAASWQSVPEIIDENGQLAINEIPTGLTVDDMDRITESCSPATFPRVRLANGFCFGIKRSVLDAIGNFDEESFPRGYGEENDFCFRAIDAGFGVVIATDCYVFHEKSKSYSSAVRDRLAKESGVILQEKYSSARIRKAVTEFRENPVLVDIRTQFRRKIQETIERRERFGNREMQGESPPRVLFVLPVKGGGGGVHSIVQETIGIRELRAHASVAVPEKAIHRYHQRYPNVDHSVFVGFGDIEELIAVAEGYDVIVATIFTSIKLVSKIVEALPHLVPAYYIQDYEPWICRDNTKLQQEAFDSYRLIPDMIRFAKTDWIRNTVEEKHGVPVQKVMPSLDTSVYFPGSDDTSNTKDDCPVRIAAMVRPKTPRRAAGSTMEILSSIKKQYGTSVDITLFGCDPEEDGFLTLRRDFEYRHLGVLIREEVAATLRESDVFVDFSTYQAFGRTALEAMACGCAVIVPEHGGTSEYAENDVNALVVDTSDWEACMTATRHLVEDRTLRERLSKTAMSTVARYSIQQAAASILSVVSASTQKRSEGTCHPSRTVRP